MLVAMPDSNEYFPALDPDARPVLFEVAWEVCNQIGGIHTVIKTKAPTMIERWGENYYLVGPFNPDVSPIEFEECEPPELLTEAVRALKDQGLDCHTGHWLVPGRPRVVLIDYRHRFESLASDKFFLWQDHGINTQTPDADVDQVIAFGCALAEFFRALAGTRQQHRLLAHFHEWMTGVAIMRVRHWRLPIATVFTTHATLLGRYVASDNPLFYQELPGLHPDLTAQHYNILSRYLIERVSAHAAHVFSTISDVTAREAEHFLGRKPDCLLPNGLNAHRFTALHEFQNLHLKYKERIHDFVMGHFFPSYTFDLDRTMYIFTSGRYEYRNKGMDVFIEALHRLNQRLLELPKPPTVIAFIITKGWTKNLNIRSLQNHLMFEDLRSACEEAGQAMNHRILEAAARGSLPSYEDLIPSDLQVGLKRAMLARRTSQLPPIVTHDMGDDSNDPILCHLRHRGLINSPKDPVKVIFHPDFLSVTNPLFNLDYDQFVRGCHMGVFPSYYEPWGYTPLECLALGLPTVTTDLSGFGAYVQNTIPDALQNGVLVVNRSRQTTEHCIDDLTLFLFRFCELSRRERIALRNRAERLTERFSWNVMVSHYHKAHAEALKRA